MQGVLSNVRSYLPKKEIVEALLQDSDTDFAIFTESWLTPDIESDELLQDATSFITYRYDRTSRRGGGVLVFVRSNIASCSVAINCSLEIVCVKLSLKTCTNILIACYRPPDCDHTFTNDLHSVLVNLTSRFPNANYILCGDFNFPDIDWKNLTASSRLSKDFLQLTLLFNLTQTVHSPTRGSNILDLVLVSNPDLVSSVSLVMELSDHKAITFHLSFPIKRKQPIKKYIRSYNKANFSAINFELESFYESFCQSASSRSVNSNWLLFKQQIENLIDKHVPLIRIRGDAGKPWYSNSLKKLSRKKKRLYRAAQKSSSASKWKKYSDCLREYAGLLRHSKRKFHHEDLKNIITVNPKKFWSILKPKNQSHNIALVYPDGSDVPLDQRANVMNSYFSSVFTSEPVHDVPALPGANFDAMPPVVITVEGILCLINKLKISSAPGPDNIPAKFLKSTKDVSSRILQIVFAQSLLEGEIPHDWRTAKVTPVFKKGNRSYPSNYRPISLTCVACKLMEHIIYSHVASHLDNNSFFFRKQHGFRPGLSCETQLFEFTTDLNLNLDSSFQTDVIYIDFSKAFDRVAHRRLMAKLSCLNLDPLTLSWIKSFLTARSQFTVIGGKLSTAAQVVSGVPQGSVLGPLLFLIFINDLPSGITSSIRLFADDCVVYRRISNSSDQSLLQRDLNLIETWCSRWLMEPNTSKCKCMVVSRKKTNLIFQYSLNSTALSHASSYRYLGVLINTKLTWSEHISSVVTDTSRSLGYLKRTLRLSPPEIRKIAYETFVRSKLEYASPIWSPYQDYLITSLESVQNRAARFISSNYNTHASVTHIKSSLELPPLAVRRRISRLSLFHKLYHNFSHLHGTLLLPPARTSRRLFNSNSVQRLHGSTVAFNKSFLPAAIEDWNCLPEAVALERNPEKFRQSLTTLFVK